MTKPPSAFISHSHEDRDIARQIAEKLQANGIKTWFDQWEIRPGDSLVQKIFEGGLKDCTLFLVVLSPASVSSAWVKHELDTAIVQRLSGATRVVPVIVRPCDIPIALRPLLRIDLSAEGVDSTVARLVDVAFNRDRHPPLGSPPPGLSLTIPGLTNHSARLAALLAGSMDELNGRLAFSGEEIAEQLSLNPEQVNDAVEELESLGLVRTRNWMGTAPYNFGQVESTPSLAFHLKDSGVLQYNPEADVRAVAAAIVQEKHASGTSIQTLTGLPPSRINRAVSYLEAYNIVTVLRVMGTAPYDFGQVTATGATRRFVSVNS